MSGRNLTKHTIWCTHYIHCGVNLTYSGIKFYSVVEELYNNKQEQIRFYTQLHFKVWKRNKPLEWKLLSKEWKMSINVSKLKRGRKEQNTHQHPTVLAQWFSALAAITKVRVLPPVLQKLKKNRNIRRLLVAKQWKKYCEYYMKSGNL